MSRFAFLLASLVVLAGCGGTSAPAPSSTPTPSPTPTASTPTAASVTPTAITVAAAQTASGVDITVGSAASSTAPNVLNLGAGNVCPVSQACNTGDVVHRGSTVMLLMFGPGLTGDMQLSLDGPKDVTFGVPIATTSTTGTAGLKVSITVSPTAALGARTLILKAANGDITTFTGGLEVAP